MSFCSFRLDLLSDGSLVTLDYRAHCFGIRLSILAYCVGEIRGHSGGVGSGERGIGRPDGIVVGRG